MNSDDLLEDPEIKAVTKQINTCFSAHDNTLRSRFVKVENAALNALEESFIKVRESGDIVKIVGVELAYLHSQMNYNKDIKVSEGEPHAIDGIEKTRVSNGLLHARSAVGLASRINNYDKYLEHLMFAGDIAVDKEGLPKDAFRVFIYNRCKALQNNMGAELIDAAKSRDRERIKNLRVAEDLYKDKQREHMERFSLEHPREPLSIKFLSKQKSVDPER